MTGSTEATLQENCANELHIELERTLRSQLPEDAFLWYNPEGESSRPAFVALGSTVGLAGLAVYDWTMDDVTSVSSSSISIDGRSFDPVGELGKSLEGMRELLNGGPGGKSLRGLILFPRLDLAEFRRLKVFKAVPQDIAVCGDELTADDFKRRIAQGGTLLTSDQVLAVRDSLYPETYFEMVKHVSVEGRGERNLERIRLDTLQEGCARTIGAGITLLSGVAVSWKSLVLAARARLLAERHPDWRIQILCFNNSLVNYLRALIGSRHPNVQISTFHSWTRKLGLWLPFVTTEEKAEKERNKLFKAIRDGVGKNSIDAILIDEGQDFQSQWLEFINTTLRRGRGGLVFAVDGAQSIYQVSKLDELFDDDVGLVSLGTNYRNTEQIGRFAYSTVFDISGEQGLTEGSPYQPTVPKFQLEGEAVQVVWAESWDGQAEFVAQEIERLVDAGRVSYGDIAVLYPKRSGTKRVAEALEEQSVPHYVLGRGADSRLGFDLAEDSVKLMTAHAAKGLEFAVVFLFGGEATKVPENLADAGDEEANRARVLFVAMTRATDLLYVTYTRPNLLVERAQDLSWSDVQRYPDDYS